MHSRTTFTSMKSKTKITVGIVDENPTYRKALSEVLTSEGFQVIWDVENQKGMIKNLSDRKPDVLIYDFYNSAERFASTVNKIRKVAPKVKMLVLSFEQDQEFINLCFSSSVNGFCHKVISDFKKLSRSLTRLVKGEKVVLTHQLV